MNRKYLDDINVTDRHDLWEGKSEKEKEWEQQRAIYGFDEREIWNLDTTFYLWLYERLKMYLEITDVDLEFNKIKYKEKDYSLLALINKLLKKIEDGYISNKDFFTSSKNEDIKEIGEIWAVLLPHMWY